jgi:hypothetical protein
VVDVDSQAGSASGGTASRSFSYTAPDEEEGWGEEEGMGDADSADECDSQGRVGPAASFATMCSGVAGVKRGGVAAAAAGGGGEVLEVVDEAMELVDTGVST